MPAKMAKNKSKVTADSSKRHRSDASTTSTAAGVARRAIVTGFVIRGTLAALLIVAFFVILYVSPPPLLLRPGFDSFKPWQQSAAALAQRPRDELFLRWFTENGGIFHPIGPHWNDDVDESIGGGVQVQLTIRKFDGMGWGLAAIVNTTSSSSTAVDAADVCESLTGCSSIGLQPAKAAKVATSPRIIIPHLSPLFTVPSNLIISIQSILNTYATSSSPDNISSPSSNNNYSYHLPNFYYNVNKVLLKFFPYGHGLTKMDRFSSSSTTTASEDSSGVIRMGLVEQDVVIAMFLMVEDCLHHHGSDSNGSFWGPYLDMLPSHPIPRLDTFTNEEYAMLNDDKLEMEGRSSLQRLKSMFHGNGSSSSSTKGGGGESLSFKSVVHDMIKIRLLRNINDSSSSSSTTTTTSTTVESTQQHRQEQSNVVPPKCLQFHTFHKFVGIVSSRAMVLKGVKYLTPLAEMINYAPVSPVDQVQEVQHQQERGEKEQHRNCDDYQGRGEKNWIHTPFDLYHTIGADESITVRSDRNVLLNHLSDSTPTTQKSKNQNDNIANGSGDGKITIKPTTMKATTTTIQIFEDYGPVDSSLFLEMHGFVPNYNPNHCAVIHGKYFLRRQVAPGRSDQHSFSLLHALQMLHLTNPLSTQFSGLEDVCVRSDLTIVDDGNVIGRRPASDAIAITLLLLGGDDNAEIFEMNDNNDDGNDNNNLAFLKSKCITALDSGDVERIELACARYPQSRRVVKYALVNAAKRSIEANSKNDSGVTTDTLLSWLEEAEGAGNEKMTLALRFRIEERKILDNIANSGSEYLIDEGYNDFKWPIQSCDTLNDNLDAKISSFNSFINSFDLPLNKIRAAQASDGMRLGAVAIEDLDSGEAYISLTPDAVIDTVSALADAEISSPRLATLLKTLDSQSQPSGDGFDVLLVYLLHERFVRKDRSKWWPYLDLLPTVQEVVSSHPLFFEEDEMNLYMGGSDVRKFILRYQRRAFERHAVLSADVHVQLVLGSNVVLDKNIVYWAHAILDSRSIWWSGRRHLCPLLDLVNADNLGRAHETKVEEDKLGLAVTRTSRPVKRGEFVFENYQQPNYLLFAFHGFMLEDNPSDCALLGGLSISNNDPGAKYASHLQTSPTFCISVSNIDSLEELAQFLLIKYGIAEKPSESWPNDAVVPYLRQLAEERIARLVESGNRSEESITQRQRYMTRMARSDLAHFRAVLESLEKIQPI